MKASLLKNKLWIIVTGMLLFSTFHVSAQCIVGGTNFDIGEWYLCDPELTNDNNVSTGWLSSSLNTVLNGYCGAVGTTDAAARHLSIEYATHISEGFQNNVMSTNRGELPFTLWAQNQYYIPPDRDPGSTAIFANPRMASPYYLGRPGDNILINVGSNSGVPFFTYTVSGLQKNTQATIKLEAFSLLHNWNNVSTQNYGGVAGYTAAAAGTISGGNSPSVRIGHTLNGTTINGGTTQAITFGNSVTVTYNGMTDGNGNITFYVARGNDSYRAPIGIDNVIITGTPKPEPVYLGEPCAKMPLVVNLASAYPSGTTYSWTESVTGETGTGTGFVFEPKDAGVDYKITATVKLPGASCPAASSDVYTITSKVCCEDDNGNPMARINIFHDDFGYFPNNSTYQYRDIYGNLYTQAIQGLYHCGGGTLCGAAWGGGEVPYAYPKLINASDLGIRLLSGDLYQAALYNGGCAVSFRQPYYAGVTQDNTSTDGRGGMLYFSIGTAGQQDLVLYKKRVDGLCQGKKIYFSAYYAPINKGISADGYPDKVGELVLEVLNASTGAVLYTTGRQVIRGGAAFARWIRAADEFVMPPGVTSVFLQVKHIGWSRCGSNDVCDYGIDDILFQVCAPPNVVMDATVKGNVSMTDLCDGNDITLTVETSAIIEDTYPDIGYLFQYTRTNPQTNPNAVWIDLAPIGISKEFVIADPPSHPIFDGLRNGEKLYFRAVVGDRTYLINERAEWISMDALSPCRAISISMFTIEASLNCKRCTQPKNIIIASTAAASVVGNIKTVNLCPPSGTTTLTTNNIKPDTEDYTNYTITWYKGNRTSVTGTAANPGVTANALTVNYADATAAGTKYYVQVVDRELPSSTSCHRWDSILVISNPVPTVGITNNSNTTVLTCATPTISLTATGGVSYAWSGGLGNNANATVNAPGTYTVTVTAASGCTNTASITITENRTPPTAGITNNTGQTVLTCTLLSINLTATGGVSYSWDNGLGSNAAATVTAAGTYTVTVTGSNGCTATQSITITADKGDAVAGITNNTGTTILNCTTSSISLTATGNGTYTWSHGLGSGANVTVNAAGTYTVTLTASNGCTDEATITITENRTPPPAAITNNTGGTVLTCAVPSISLTATGGGTYAWNNGMGDNAAITVTTPATYTVTVTGSNGCTATSSVTITENRTLPSAGITNPPTTELTCTTQSISLTATGGGTYAWSHSLGSGATVAVSVPATYTVTVRGTNGCEATANLQITENKILPIAGITNNSNPVTTVLTCTEPSISLTATGGGTYLWSGGLGTNANATVTAPATYTVTVTAPNGCIATESIAITENKVFPTAVITNTPAVTELTCTLLSINLTASGGVTYAWSNGSTNASIDVTAPGTYTVTAKAANGCTATKNITITENKNPPVVGITNNTGETKLTCTLLSISLTATGGGTYTWSNGATGASLNVTAPGTYTVTVKAPNECTNTASVTITESKDIPTVTVANADICLGAEATLTASGDANSYTWTTGETGATITVAPTSTITYTVEGTVEATGCSAKATATVSVETPIGLKLEAPKSIELGKELEITIIADRTDHGSFEWFINDQPYKTISEYVLKLHPDGGKQHFRVHTATAKLGCPSSAEIYVEVAEFVPNVINPYNPGGGNCCFMIGYHVEIYNRYMQKIFEGDNGWNGTYRGAIADPGTYFYRIYKKGGQVEKGTLEVVKF